MLKVSGGYQALVKLVCMFADPFVQCAGVGPAGRQRLQLPPCLLSVSERPGQAAVQLRGRGGTLPSGHLHLKSGNSERQMWDPVCTCDVQFALSGTSLSSDIPASHPDGLHC